MVKLIKMCAVAVFIMIMNGVAYGFSESNLQSCTTASDCTSYGDQFCGMQDSTTGTVQCGTALYNGTSYSKRCYCLVCGTGTTYPAASTTTNAFCIWNQQCSTVTEQTNTVTHVIKQKYTTQYTNWVLKDASSTIPSYTPKSLCEAKESFFECMDGYGYVTRPTSLTSAYCVDCDGGYYSTDNGKTWTAHSGPTGITDYSTNTFTGGYARAWNFNTSVVPTSAPASVAASNCGTNCAGTCYYASLNYLYVSSSLRYGAIATGCPVQYGTKCSCSNTTAVIGNPASCKCSAGYYGSNPTSSTSCTKCASATQSYTTSAMTTLKTGTSSVGSTAATSCYIGKNTTLYDEKGVFTTPTTANCYYSTSATTNLL